MAATLSDAEMDAICAQHGEPQAAVIVATAPVVTLELATAVTGPTRKAIEGKIARGDWLRGREYHRAPDGRIYIDLKGYQQWVVTGQA